MIHRAEPGLFAVIPLEVSAVSWWLVAAASLTLLALVAAGWYWRRRSTVSRAARRVLFALMIGGLVSAGIAVWIGTRNDEGSPTRSRPSTTIVPGRNWPLDRGSLLRTGNVDGSEGPGANGRILWRRFRSAGAIYSSPAVVGNRLFVVVTRGDTARLHCLEIGSGDLLWSSGPTGYRATFSSPVYADGFVFCGEGLHSTRDGRLVCWDVRDPLSARVVWTFPTRGHVECTPVIDGDFIYFGAGDDGLYALRWDRKASAPTVAFHLTKNCPDVETSLAVHDGRLFCGLGTGGEAICLLDAMTGRELARWPRPFPVFSPPAIANGKLFVGVGAGDFLHPESAMGGQIVCLDLTSLQIAWTHPLPGTVLGAIAVEGGRLFFGCGDGSVYELSSDGQTVRRCETGAAIVAAVALTPTTVFAVNQMGMLIGIRRDSFTPSLRFRLGQPGCYVSSPVVAQGCVFVGTDDEGLVCVGE